MMKDKNMDELFREKLRDFEQNPPAHLLDHILKATADAKRKKRLLVWRLSGVAAALLIAFVAGWQISKITSEQVVKSAINPEKIQFSEKIGERAEEKSMLEREAGQPFSTSAGLITPEVLSGERQMAMKSGTPKVDSETSDRTRGDELLREPMALMKMRTSGFRSKAVPVESLKLKKVQKDPAPLAFRLADEQMIAQNQRLLEQEKAARKSGKWMVGAQVSPLYNVSNTSHAQMYAANMLNSSTSNPVELGGGISVGVKTGKRLSIQSGIYYSALEQTSGNSVSAARDYLFAGGGNGADYLSTNVRIDASTHKLLMNGTAGVIEMSGIPDGVELGTNLEDKALTSAVVASDARFTQNFEYLEIPVYLRYLVVDSRFSVEMLGGLSSNLLITNQAFMESGSVNSLIGKTRDMEPVIYSGSLGLGLKYGLSKRFFLNVEPKIKYYLNSLNSNSAVDYKPYTIGVYTGLSYQF